MPVLAFIKGLSATRKVIAAIALIIVVLLAFNFVNGLLNSGAKVKARLGANQTDAAIESGVDAVETVSGVASKEADASVKERELNEKLDKADSVGDAHAIGANSLCDDYNIGCKE